MARELREAARRLERAAQFAEGIENIEWARYFTDLAFGANAAHTGPVRLATSGRDIALGHLRTHTAPRTPDSGQEHSASHALHISGDSQDLTLHTMLPDGVTTVRQTLGRVLSVIACFE